MRKPIRHALLAAASTCLLSATAAANDDATTYGWVEKATIEPWGTEVKVKLDSGALTSSMHAEEIETFDKAGDEWVRFTVEVEDEASNEEVSKRFEAPLYRDLTVRGAGGKDQRPVVLMKLCMNGTIREEQFGLEDRDDMNYPVLLGRRAIQHLGPIDVTRTFMHDPACREGAPVRAHDDGETDEDIGA